jgi:hypothetical protein
VDPDLAGHSRELPRHQRLTITETQQPGDGSRLWKADCLLLSVFSTAVFLYTIKVFTGSCKSYFCLFDTLSFPKSDSVSKNSPSPRINLSSSTATEPGTSTHRFLLCLYPLSRPTRSPGSTTYIAIGLQLFGQAAKRPFAGRVHLPIRYVTNCFYSYRAVCTSCMSAAPALVRQLNSTPTPPSPALPPASALVRQGTLLAPNIPWRLSPPTFIPSCGTLRSVKGSGLTFVCGAPPVGYLFTHEHPHRHLSSQAKMRSSWSLVLALIAVAVAQHTGEQTLEYGYA